MKSIDHDPVTDESGEIGPVVDALAEQFTLVLRLVRPAQAGPIARAVEEIARLLKLYGVRVTRKAYLQAAEASVTLLERLERLEAELTCGRAAGGDAPHE